MLNKIIAVSALILGLAGTAAFAQNAPSTNNPPSAPAKSAPATGAPALVHPEQKMNSSRNMGSMSGHHAGHGRGCHIVIVKTHRHGKEITQRIRHCD